MSVREGRWICPSCGAENLGRNKRCDGHGSAGCGAARPESVRFYLPEQSPVVTDPGLLTLAQAGPDWHCSHCDGANLNAIAGRRVLKCVHCGNIRDEEDKDRRVSSYAPGAQPASAAALVEPRRRPVSPAARREDRSAPAKRPARRLPIAWILGAIALVLGLAASFLVTWTVEQTVAATSWERRIAVEEFRTLTQEDWDPPSDARILDRETRIRTHRQVIDRYETKTRSVSRQVQSGSESYACGTRDLGNGFFEDRTCSRPTYRTEHSTETYQEPVYRSEPVYDTWFTFQVDRWVKAREAVTAGDQQPEWPDPKLLANQREGRRAERYSVILVDGEGKSSTRNLPLGEWNTVGKGDAALSRRNIWGLVGQAEWLGGKPGLPAND